MDEKQASAAKDKSAPSLDTSALERILGDPEALAKLSSAMNALRPSPGDAAKDIPTASPTTPPSSTDGLARLLSDPGMMERLPQMLALVKPLLGADAAKPTSAEAVPAIAPHAPSLDRDHLLLALKPFLSEDRRTAVDAILRISKLGELIRQIK